VFDQSKVHSIDSKNISLSPHTLQSFFCYSFIMFLSSNKFNLQASRLGLYLFIAQCTIGIFTLCCKNRFSRLGGCDSSFSRRGGSNLIKDPKTPSGIICIIFIKPFSLDTQLNFNKHRAASYMLAQTARERARDRRAHKGRKNTISHARQCAHWQFLSPPCPERWRRRAAGWH